MSSELEEAEKERRVIQSLRTGQRERFFMEAMDLAKHQLQHNPEISHEQMELLDPLYRQLQTMDALERFQ